MTWNVRSIQINGGIYIYIYMTWDVRSNQYGGGVYGIKSEVKSMRWV